HPDLAPPEKKYESTMHCLEDLTCILTMERKPLALELAEEVMACQKEEEKSNIWETITQYSKLLASVKTTAQMAEVVYDNCGDRDRVASILVATHE
ncbi:hypothetical protein KI387_039853, partial [Taxus chinensis]